jgi:hypothetical protein
MPVRLDHDKTRNEIHPTVLNTGKMSSIKATREPSASDKQAYKDLFYTMPLVERGTPVLIELKWVLLGRQGADQHPKILPDYCYNIFDVFLKTYFKAFPALSEIIMVTDQAGLSAAKTIEEAKKVIRLDWKNLGRMFGITMRSLRYFELEASDDLERDGVADSTPEKVKELFTMIAGKQWVEENLERIMAESANALFIEELNKQIAAWIGEFKKAPAKFDVLAYQWSPTAMTQLRDGFAEGMTSFLDETGQPVGESSRSGIYTFLLLVWPEIKATLEASPKKTLSDLHEWMQPFMRMGITAYIEIETLRDVCAPPPSGIGLSLRPLKTRQQSA